MCDTFVYGCDSDCRYIGVGFYNLFIQSQVFSELNMDAFGYQAARYPGLAPERVPYQIERDELQQVMASLRARYGRRRLFRIADVAEVVREIRRERDFATPQPVTPRREEPPTVRRLHIDMNID